MVPAAARPAISRMTHLAPEIVHLTSGGHKSHEIEDIVGRQVLYVASLSKINSVATATSSELTATKYTVS